MKLIKNKVEKLEQKHDLLGVYEQIEIAGRTAYKSLDKIEYDENGRSKTAKEFVDKMIKLGHGSPLEHGTVYLNVPINIDVAGNYIDNQYTRCKLVTESDRSNNWWAVTTNYRVLVENNLLDDLRYICEPTEYHELRTTFRLTCARVQADSFVRHRVFSFLMESTRYCNYNNGKFGKIVKGTDDSCKFIIDYFENNVPINKSEMQDYISKFTIPVQIKKINEILE